MAIDLVCSANRGFMSTSPSLIRVFTVDDHALLREGIAALVNAEPDMELVAEASDGMELVAEASDGEEAIKQFQWHRSHQPHQERIPERQDHSPIDLFRGCSGPARHQSGCSGIHPEGTRAQRTVGRDPECPCRTQANTARNRGGAG